MALRKIYHCYFYINDFSPTFCDQEVIYGSLTRITHGWWRNNNIIKIDHSEKNEYLSGHTGDIFYIQENI